MGSKKVSITTEAEDKDAIDLHPGTHIYFLYRKWYAN